MRFDKFTAKAQEAIQEAQQKAFKMHHQSLEPLHLLWAMAVQPEGVVSPTFEKMGIPPDRIAFEAERALGSLPQVSGNVEQYLSPALNRVFMMAAEEAEEPKRTIPIAYIAGILTLIVWGIYKLFSPGRAEQL